MNFLRFKMTDNNSLIKSVANTCEYCEDYTTVKMKKCLSCGERNVCRECYYDGKTLCETCDEAYVKQMKSLILKSKVYGCDYCGNEDKLKSKKCDDCGERKICKSCYYDDEQPLCECCSNKYYKWGAKIENVLAAYEELQDV